MKMQKWQIPMTIVLFISSFLLVYALRALAAIEPAPGAQKNDSLISMIRTQETDIKGLESDISKSRTAMDQYQKVLSVGQSSSRDLQNQVQQYKVLAGLTDVSGSGIVSTLDDNRKGYDAELIKNPGQVKPEDYTIHDKYILSIVNELRAAGAEAICVNDQRIVNSTDIRCAGAVILVNTTRLAPPYQIKAIGDPDRLSKLINQADSQFYILKQSGFPVTIDKQSHLTIPSFKGSYQFNYAHLIKEVK